MMKRVKAKLYAFFFWQTNFGDFLNKVYDLSLYYKYSFNHKKYKDEDNLRAGLTKEYHIIEKGMSLPKPRTAFGKEKIFRMIKLAKNYEVKYGDSDKLLVAVKESLNEYINFNKNRKEDISNPYYQDISDFASNEKCSHWGGTKLMSRSKIEFATNIDYEEFINQRVSVRNFSSADITKDEINRAINIAKIAPSVCNRQAWKAHVYLDNNEIHNLLNYQHGNSGFGDSIKALIVVTGNLKAFTMLESNQVFIDGGIFSMSLILALHSKGFGSCAMNTCIPYVDEKKIKIVGKIPNHERLIMMIGVGKLKEEFRVPISKKKDNDQIVTFH